MSGLKKTLLAAACITAVAGAYLCSRTKKAKKEDSETPDSVNDYRKLRGTKHNIMFGTVGEDEEVISISADRQESGRNSNVLVFGGTGTGKNYSYQFSNLLAGNTSAVVEDLHGEYVFRQEKLKENGLKVFVFDTDERGSDELVKQQEEAIRYISQNKGVIFITGNEDCCSSSDYISDIFYQLCKEADRIMPVMFYLENCDCFSSIFDFDKMLAAAKAYKIGFHILQQSINSETKDVSALFDSILYLSDGLGRSEDTLKWIAEKAEMDIEKVMSLPADKALLIVKGLNPIELDKLLPFQFLKIMRTDSE